MSFQQGLSGLNAASRSLDVIGHNIANASTTGMKASRAEFAQIYASSAGGVGGSNAGLGVQVDAVAQQFTQGGITITGNSLDVAINGGGLFELKNTDGSASYTRAGNFKLDKDGNIVTNAGAKVIGVDGNPLKLPAPVAAPAPQVTGVQIANDGKLSASYSDGHTDEIGQFRLVNFANPQGLAQNGIGDWAETSASGAPTTGAPGTGLLGQLRSGALEESNVDLTAELVNMMTTQRAYQANAQTIKTQDQIMSTLVNLR